MRRARKLGAAVLAGAVTLTVVAASAPSSSSATGATNGSAYASAGYSGNLAAVSATLTGSIFGVSLSALQSAILAPVQSTLGALTTSLSQNTLNGLVQAAPVSASNDSTMLTRPTSGYPTCGSGGWDASGTGNCYNPTQTLNIAAAPLATVTTGLLQGYATDDATGYVGASSVASPVVSLLGLNILNLGLVQSQATCNQTPTCAATETMSSSSLLGGAVTMSVANGVDSVAVNGVSLLPSTSKTITFSGMSTKISLNATNLVTVAITLNSSTLLTALGIPSIFSSLPSLLSGLLGGLTNGGVSATLTVTVGPGNTIVTGTNATAWGLAVTADLEASVSIGGLSLLGLLPLSGGVTLSVGDTTPGSGPNLLNMEFGYARAQAGTAAASWLDPGTI
ncbi:hypothetical protein [Jatrophihabitans sp.]|uniref:hypothetical protein n=1 Tax=Jatrophihabitans sp. TaxID=1932789 RepID=UPI0030C77B35|nr:hypothetical protein [Jatrophihabitans sp.]